VRGTNEIASAVGVFLKVAGYSVVLSHGYFPPVIRRAMVFRDALFGDRTVVDEIKAERAETAVEIASVLPKSGHVAVTPLHPTYIIALRSPQILIDARIQNIGSRRIVAASLA